METKLTVQQVDTAKPTRKGAPQISVKTVKGWVKVRGQGIKDVRIGDVLVLVDEPNEYNKSWYAELNRIERPNGRAAPAATSTDRVSLDEILDVIDRVMNRLPGEWKDAQCLQGQRACASIINTVLIGVQSGQIEADSEPDLETGPMPDNSDVPPWERG